MDERGFQDIEALERDALRYRWLRGRSKLDIEVPYPPENDAVLIVHGFSDHATGVGSWAEQIDAAIDKAMHTQTVDALHKPDSV